MIEGNCALNGLCVDPVCGQKCLDCNFGRHLLGYFCPGSRVRPCYRRPRSFIRPRRPQVAQPVVPSAVIREPWAPGTLLKASVAGGTDFLAPKTSRQRPGRPSGSGGMLRANGWALTAKLLDPAAIASRSTELIVQLKMCGFLWREKHLIEYRMRLDCCQRRLILICGCFLVTGWKKRGKSESKRGFFVVSRKHT